MPSVELGSRKIDYSVVRGTSRRYTYFRFRSDMTLEVVVPRGRPLDVDRAIRGRAGWILREHERMERARRVLG